MKINANKAFLLGPVLASGVVGALAIVMVLAVTVQDQENTSSAAYSGRQYVLDNTRQMRGSATTDRFANYNKPEYECDVWPRETGGDGKVTKEDYDLVGQFSVGSLVPKSGKEFQKADCAPKATGGDGLITVADWVQVGRYSAGLDSLQVASGPTEPVKANLEGDVWPRETGGDGKLTKEDWDLLGQFSVGSQTPANGLEFQKADCAPKATGGDGLITVADWVQAGRYSVGLDPVQTVSGPTSPTQ